MWTESYPDSVETIALKTDDAIFFSKLLMGDLVSHGQGLAKRFGRAAPKIHEPDFSKVPEPALFPPEHLYEDWLKAFRTPSTL